MHIFRAGVAACTAARPVQGHTGLEPRQRGALGCGVFLGPVSHIPLLSEPEFIPNSVVAFTIARLLFTIHI